MPAIKNISIHQPCNEEWSKMEPDIDGRYCMHCCKTGTDFTVMSNAEVIAYLRDTGNVCGRFKKEQLSSINILIAYNTVLGVYWKKIWVAATLMSIIPFIQVEAKQKPGTEQLSKVPEKDHSPMPVDTTHWIVLKGHVIAGDDSTPMPGTSVYTLDKMASTSTDLNGDFKLMVSSSADSVVFSFIGYKKQTFKITDISNNIYAVKMEVDPTIARLTDVVVGGVFVRYSFTRRVWNKIKRIF